MVSSSVQGIYAAKEISDNGNANGSIDNKFIMFRTQMIAFNRICRNKRRFVDTKIEKMEQVFSNNKTKHFFGELRDSAKFKPKTKFVEEEEGDLLAHKK